VKGDYGAWAAARLVAEEGAILTPSEARTDYMGWCSDQRLRWHPLSKQRAAIKAAGGTVKGFKDKTRYHGVRLVGPFPDSGYRVNHDEPIDPTPALVALASIAHSRTSLDVAYVRLTTGTGNICSVCGYPTRHPDKHLDCEPYPAVLAKYCAMRREGRTA
jgi:hypothetical protein